MSTDDQWSFSDFITDATQSQLSIIIKINRGSGLIQWGTPMISADDAYDHPLTLVSDGNDFHDVYRQQLIVPNNFEEQL